MRSYIVAILLALTATPAAAQITIPNTFVAGTVANPDDVNTNFSTLGTQALNRTGGTMTGALASSFFGTNTWSAGGTGGQILALRNTTAGGGNYAQLLLGNDATASVGYFTAFSSTFTTSGRSVAAGVLLEGAAAGGLSLAASHASGVVRVYAGGVAEVARFNSAGLSVGTTSAPAAGGIRTTNALMIDNADPGNVAVQFLVSGSQLGGVGLTDAFLSDGSSNLGLRAESGKSVLIYANGSSTASLTAHASGGVSVGSTVDPGAFNFRVGGAATIIGAASVGGDLAVTANASAARFQSASAQPGFFAYNNTSDGTVGGGATAEFDTESYDTTSSFASNTFTAPVTGIYEFNVSVAANTCSAPAVVNARLVTTASGNIDMGGQEVTNFGVVSGAAMVSMTAGNTASVVFDVTGGATCTLVGKDGGSTIWSYFSGRLMP